MKTAALFFGVFASFLFFISYSTPAAYAADPQLLITWKSASLAPYDFSGKLLPAASSPINVSAEVLLGNGRLANLSGETIYWYANDKLVAGGAGVQTAVFQAPLLPGGTISVRAQLPGFQGSFLAKTINISIANPLAIIEAPLPGTTFSGSEVHLKAHAYYFNVPDSTSLTFAWNINGTPPTSAGDPEVLNISVDPKAGDGTPIAVNLKIKNPDILYEAAEAATTLIYRK